MHAGDAERSCDKSDISVMVLKIGGDVIQNQQVYAAVFQTSCSCNLTNVHVLCDGLQNSILHPDASFVEVDSNGMCTLNKPVTKLKPLQITYSSEAPVNFRVLNATSAC
jgi:hypothetical protein